MTSLEVYYPSVFLHSLKMFISNFEEIINLWNCAKCPAILLFENVCVTVRKLITTSVAFMIAIVYCEFLRLPFKNRRFADSNFTNFVLLHLQSSLSCLLVPPLPSVAYLSQSHRCIQPTGIGFNSQSVRTEACYTAFVFYTM